jgi:hypothetical protein
VSHRIPLSRKFSFYIQNWLPKKLQAQVFANS